MVTASQIEKLIDVFAPFAEAEDFDNVGILYESSKQTDAVLFALDITGETVKEAAERGCGILVSHHPAMLRGIKSLKYDDAVALAVKNDVSLIAAHTNLDKADGGVNDALAKAIGLTLTGDFCEKLGKTGLLPQPLAPGDFALHVKEKLGLAAIFTVQGNRPVQTVAVGGGAYDFVLPAHIALADALVTGELKHHQALEAKALGLTAIAAGHFATEDPGVTALMEYIKSRLSGGVKCYKSKNRDPFDVV